MRFQKSELAFFVFIFLLSGLAILIFVTLQMFNAAPDQGQTVFANVYAGVERNLKIAGGMIVVIILFGIFFIYPLIRHQMHEENKLRAMTRSLSERSQSLEHQALTDSLTGMQNRRYFDDALSEYLKEFKRIGKPIGLMILDLDHFKQINDTHGHDVGDEVLREVARCLHEFTRYHDVVARLGGEEFAVVTPNMNEEMLRKLAERIRRAISDLTIVTVNVNLRVTTSLGLAVWNKRESADEFYRRADKMLYQAKREGRNRVCA